MHLSIYLSFRLLHSAANLIAKCSMNNSLIAVAARAEKKVNIEEAFRFIFLSIESSDYITSATVKVIQVMADLQTFQLAHLPPDLLVYVALYQDLKNAPFLRQQLLNGNSVYEYAFVDASVVSIEGS